MTVANVERRAHRMSVVHALVVGAAVFAFLFALLWASEAAGIGPSTRELMRLLTRTAADASLAALMAGLPFAIALGAIVGATLAIFANAFHFLDKR